MKPRRTIVPHPTDAALALVPLTRGYFAVISAVDAEAVGQFLWRVAVFRNTCYARRSLAGSTEELQRFIARLAKIGVAGGVIDHIDRDGLNCRRSNLRPASRSQNNANSDLHRSNSSGIRGVTWRKSGWQAQAVINQKYTYLGVYATKEEAGAIAAAARVAAYGEFALQQ